MGRRHTDRQAGAPKATWLVKSKHLSQTRPDFDTLPIASLVSTMSDTKAGKVLIKRPAKVHTDSRGRSVWADPIESAELELVSTQTLKQILSSTDDTHRESIKEVAGTESNGVLARDTATGMFKIIDDDELQHILDNDSDLPKIQRPSDVTLEPLHDYADVDHLSLVSTQALKRVLNSGGKDEKSARTPDTDDDDPNPNAGFNPYDSA